MRRSPFWTAASVGAAALAVQIGVVPVLFGPWLQPDVPLATACWFALFAPMSSAVGAAATVGLAVDIASAVPLGFHLAPWTAAAFAVGLSKRWVRREEAWSQAAVCAVASAATFACQGMMAWVSGFGFGVASRQAFGAAFGTALVAWPLAWLLKPLSGSLRESERDLARMRGF